MWPEKKYILFHQHLPINALSILKSNSQPINGAAASSNTFLIFPLESSFNAGLMNFVEFNSSASQNVKLNSTYSRFQIDAWKLFSNVRLIRWDHYLLSSIFKTFLGIYLHISTAIFHFLKKVNLLRVSLNLDDIVYII